jgi:hypothetical protein
LLAVAVVIGAILSAAILYLITTLDHNGVVAFRATAAITPRRFPPTGFSRLVILCDGLGGVE